MAKPVKEAVQGEVIAEEIPGQEEIPAWAVADPGDQEMAKYVAPSANQWRRKLNEFELMEWVKVQVESAGRDQAAVGQSIFAQIALADTLEEVISGSVDTTKGREILDTILECHSIKFVRGDKEDGCPYFVICDVRNSATNEREVLSVGGWMVLAQMARMHYQSMELTPDSPYLAAEGTPGASMKESFPHYFKIRKKTTPNGEMNYLAPAMS